MANAIRKNKKQERICTSPGNQLILYISEEWHFRGKSISRVWALIILFVCVGGFAIVCARSQVAGSSLKIMGQTVFDFTDMFTSNFILPIGGIAACVLVGWLMNKDVVFNELTSEGRFNAQVVRFFYWLARYVCPIVIVLVQKKLTQKSIKNESVK